MEAVQRKISQLNETIQLSAEQVEQFKEDGFIQLRQVLSKKELRCWRLIIRAAVERHNTEELALEDRDTYGKAFLQTVNLWQVAEEVIPFVFSKRLADIARQLLEVTGVRLYHDQALFKEGGGGHTPWHVDQQYWPMASEKSITAWIPLQEVTADMGPLAFGKGSHSIKEGRDLQISDESQRQIEGIMQKYGISLHEEAFDLGDVSFHYGWTHHRAGPNTTDKERSIMTMIYMDQDMIVSQPDNPQKQNDLNAYFPGCQPGDKAATYLNPILT